MSTNPTPTLPTTQAEALAAGSKYYYTGKPCKSGHLSPRNSKSMSCLECQRLYAAARYAANPEKQQAATARYRAANLEKVREAERKAALKYYAENREEIQKKAAEFREANREALRVQAAEYRAAHPERVRESDAAHRAGPACPSWADREAMREVYARCPEGWVVDHIVPLNGDVVCGLHVPWNLQCLPEAVNARKGKKFNPDDPEHLEHLEAAYKAKDGN